MITAAQLQAMGAARENAARYAPDFARLLPLHEIDTPRRIQHFMAQVFHESGALARVKENMNYRADRLVKVFPRYFTADLAVVYAGQPERIGSRVYANRMGNGDEYSGDGYRYRGRGLIQVTGKTNYRMLGEWVGEDLVTHPERVAMHYPVDSAVWYWVRNGLNALADGDDIRQVTQRINGGQNGIEDRRRLLVAAREIFK